MESLRRMASPTTRPRLLTAIQGDIIVFEEGDVIVGIAQLICLVDRDEKSSRLKSEARSSVVERIHAYELFGLAIILAIIVFSVNKWKVSDEVAIYAISLVIPEGLIAAISV
ncbi:15647_t:CDS:2 [Rhizophagus irregularis]|nr:15647_t:CDS:2 [Rhizophagus irregularis]